jgi:hypothetical protein
MWTNRLDSNGFLGKYTHAAAIKSVKTPFQSTDRAVWMTEDERMRPNLQSLTARSQSI